MKKVYDRFADEYIDESEKIPYAPPERYTEITEELLVENAARWFLTALKRLLDEDADHKADCFLCKWLGKVDVCGRCRNRNLFAEADTEPQAERSSE